MNTSLSDIAVYALSLLIGWS